MKTHPNMFKSQTRHFGAKLAQPSRVFKAAVKQAVNKIAEGKSFEEAIEEVMGKRAKRRRGLWPEPANSAADELERLQKKEAGTP